ncbi:hypothetical protein [Spirosoma foliorum]|uniref:Uncharacterized protein n=1 Tax=Spirosoma foliorum TaxID=2710596 RepID=A0A7G5GXC3_9BACT|nr:hypothetical protein [Spirosoma foliorum]QMW03515.1 hypothetical protein H3H32_00670 [Spirosoma foliorum]
MNEQELTQNYMKAFEHLLRLMSDVDNAIDRSRQSNDSLGVRQYEHLKKDYVQQLADLISKAPKSVTVQAVIH